MGKLYFNYSTMNAGKSTALLQAAFNYHERGMQTYLLTARLDHRSGTGKIASRVGLAADADTFAADDDLFAKIAAEQAARPIVCVFVDENGDTHRFTERSRQLELPASRTFNPYIIASPNSSPLKIHSIQGISQ